MKFHAHYECRRCKARYLGPSFEGQAPLWTGMDVENAPGLTYHYCGFGDSGFGIGALIAVTPAPQEQEFK